MLRRKVIDEEKDKDMMPKELIGKFCNDCGWAFVDDEKNMKYCRIQRRFEKGANVTACDEFKERKEVSL